MLQIGVCVTQTALFLSLAPAQPKPSSEIQFRVHTADGKNIFGSLNGVDSDWSIRIGETQLRGRNIISVSQTHARSPAHPLMPHLILTNGDRLPLELAGGFQFANERFQMKTAQPLRAGKNAELQLSLLFVKAVWIKTPSKTIAPERFFRRLLNETRSHDVILLTNGDRVAGTILNADSRKSCRIKIGKKVTDVPFKRVAALYFNANLAIPAPRKNGNAHAVLKNGARITLSTAKLDGAKKQWIGKSVYRFPAIFTLDNLVALTLHHDRVVYLSDLKPSKYEHRPFFERKWDYSKNSSLLGAALRLRELGTFDWGIGVHTGSRLTYELGGKYDWLEAWVGLDPDSGSLGSARARITIDGKKTIYASKTEILAIGPPHKIRVPVTGAKRLELNVENGSRGNVRGHTNWINARLIKR